MFFFGWGIAKLLIKHGLAALGGSGYNYIIVEDGLFMNQDEVG